MAEEVKDAVVEDVPEAPKKPDNIAVVAVDQRDRERIDVLLKGARFKAKQATKQILDEAQAQVNFLLASYGNEGDAIQSYDLQTGALTIEKDMNGNTA